MTFIEQTGTRIGDYAPDFELRGVDRQVHHLSDYLQQFRAVGVVTLSNHCLYVRTYLNCLKQLQTQFQPAGFTLIGINGNDDRRYPEDGFGNMISFADDQQLNFPYLRDATQDVLRSFGAEYTPEAFLVDAQGKLCYRGAIDDANHQLNQAVHHYFEDAIAQLLADQPIAVVSNPATGSTIKWRS
ncbi:MAG: thioredoxin family protein [Leptolyngbya sp. DLM2.Bin15]|nr:MAG: thioredoxin family protein [Leptolyngbya sp. DLM2.Bin15]